MSVPKKHFISAVIFCCAMALAQTAANAPKVIVSAMEVTEINDIQTRRYTGTLVSPAIISVVSRVSGDLQEIGFSEGDFVKKGQVLYRIDPTRYAATVKSAEANIAQFEARLIYSKNNFERINALFEKAVSTKDEMENALSEYQATQASLAAAKANLILANDDLTHTTIMSAIDGKIGLTNFTVGNYITPASGVMATVVQLNPIRLKFAISNRDFLEMFGTAAVLKETGKVSIVLADDTVYSIGGAPVQGELEFIDNEANRSTDTVQVYFRIANPDFVLIPQSTVKVILRKDNQTAVPAVLPSAVMNDGKTAYVYVLDETNTVSRRDVTTGTTNGDRVIIKAGLKKGERVITAGTHKVRPGVQVSILGEAN